ncbi:MAG TPA: N-acetylmuramoyl-L-alanine amidase [Nocardioidaceae bacterium]|nr:N-acetylmuramoyl-L-alanine amidase [Nocardioidaceae bacterium]
MSVVLASSLFVLLPFLSGMSANAARTTTPANPAGPPTAAALLVAPAAARPVTPQLRQVPLPAAPRPGTPTTRPARSAGFAVVGATWQGATPAGLRVSVRTRSGERWSSWTPLPVEVADHGPDRGTVESRRARRGTDPVVVGDVDLVQMRATSHSGRTPRALRLSLVNPGTSPADDDPAMTDVRRRSPAAVASARLAPRPRIRSRAAWGANERLRTRRPTYGTVRAGFVHHTVNSNRYSRSDVPAIIRGIYAYHTQGRGWSDIGYNFLVDRFGRIWEGRFGGVARNVIGAHTLGYNHLSFAMSAIGNFQTARPSPALVRAFGRLMAWKLGLNGVTAGSRNQRLRGRALSAISGHRDAGQTACPGVRLYQRIPAIRRTAVRAQQGGTTPTPPPPAPVPTPPPPTEEDGGPGPG